MLNILFQISTMKVTTPEISWHERDPIYSVDIQPGCHRIRRLVSGGVDKFVRVGLIIWMGDRLKFKSLKYYAN